MNLYLKIKQDQLLARKEKNKPLADTLSVILAQADKELISRKTEEEQNSLMLSLVMAYDKSLSKNIAQFADKADLVEKYQQERQFIAAYLPKPLGEEEIKEILINHGLTTVPDAMKYFSQHYKGRFDAKMVTKLLA